MASHDGEWQQDKLFDAWYLTSDWQVPEKLEWPEEMDGWPSLEKSRWGVLMVKRAIFAHMDGAIVIHRGDAPVWTSTSDGSYRIQGDVEVEWEGRSPIFEVKTQLPALRIRGGRAPACQGIDDYMRFDYLNEQKRSGRPLYVVFAWPDVERRSVVLVGERIDRLDWPPHEDSLNRNRGRASTKMAYWYVDRLSSFSELVADVEAWSGEPFQLSLV